MPITFEQVGYIYQLDTPFEYAGLKDVSFTIEDRQYMAIIGHTGSGKSTLIQHLNALLKPTHGIVKVDDYSITNTTKEKNLKSLRQKVGVVFQFPESQLFEETVLKDVMFGPLNFGETKENAQKLAEYALNLVGIDETLYDRSPFDLSGGQMRRVAIAGILAIKPKVLVLDEPTAGLDPKGRLDIMNVFQTLYEKERLTIVLVTHQMDDAVLYAKKVAVLANGRIQKIGTPQEVFSQREWVVNQQIGLPHAMEMVYRLRKAGVDLPESILTNEALIDVLAERLGGS